MLPAAQATRDREFVEAVTFVNTQVGRVYAWTKQQLSSRGPQTLLEPCKEAAMLKDRIKEELGQQIKDDSDEEDLRGLTRSTNEVQGNFPELFNIQTAN